MPRQHLGLLLAGLAAGESLGSTSEFSSREDVLGLYERYSASGWPFAHVGGGRFEWRPGQPTDDTETALCMVRSYLAGEVFDPEDFANRLVAWAKSGPREIGATTVHSIGSISLGTPWFEGGLEDFHTKPKSVSNGSLARNGVVPGMADDLAGAYRISLYQGITTHYAPLPVLCCAIQTYLIWEFLEGRDPLKEGWLREFWANWLDWYNETKNDEIIESWSTNVVEQYPKAYKALSEADFNPDSFSPISSNPRGSAGRILTTLQAAIWAVHWSLRDDEFPVPAGYPPEVFAKRGPWVLGWLALSGGDSNSYGATAGPIIAAAHRSFPRELVEGLEINEEFGDLISGATTD